MSFFYLFFVDHDNESTVCVFVAKLTALVKQHGDLVYLHHHVREKELNTMHGFFEIELDWLLATSHVSVSSRGLIAHATLLQINYLVAVVAHLLNGAQSLQCVHEVCRGRIVHLLACIVSKVVLERDSEILLSGAQVRKLCYLDLKEGVGAHNLGQFSQEDLVIDACKVTQTLLYGQVVILLEQLEHEVALCGAEVVDVVFWVYLL